jgi:putative PIN family toxin of toxin-antitoxin system
VEKSLVLDTHGWISIFYRGRLEDTVQSLSDKRITLISCSEQFKEFKDVRIKHSAIAKMLTLHPDYYVRTMKSISNIFEPDKRYRLLPDYKDNYLVDLAHQTESTLVSNDKDFRTLKKLRSPKITIISLKEFYELLYH